MYQPPNDLTDLQKAILVLAKQNGGYVSQTAHGLVFDTLKDNDGGVLCCATDAEIIGWANHFIRRQNRERPTT